MAAACMHPRLQAAPRHQQAHCMKAATAGTARSAAVWKRTLCASPTASGPSMTALASGPPAWEATSGQEQTASACHGMHVSEELRRQHKQQVAAVNPCPSTSGVLSPAIRNSCCCSCCHCRCCCCCIHVQHHVYPLALRTPLLAWELTAPATPAALHQAQYAPHHASRAQGEFDCQLLEVRSSSSPVCMA
jgi:hypothetical protein